MKALFAVTTFALTLASGGAMAQTPVQPAPAWSPPVTGHNPAYMPMPDSPNIPNPVYSPPVTGPNYPYPSPTR